MTALVATVSRLTAWTKTEKIVKINLRLYYRQADNV